VLAFHEVRDGARFRDRLEWLRAEYDVVSLADLPTHPIADRSAVALTFDDGYGSWHETAAPILRALDLPATFFVCSGFVGLTGNRADAFRRECLGRTQWLRPLTRRELGDLAGQDRFEIGSHTRHHVDLGRPLEPARLADEIDGDRHRLEDWTARPVTRFAYPFGRTRNVSPAAVERVAGAGFRAAFTFVPGFLDDEADPFRARRDGLDERDSTALWRARLGGAYDRLYGVKERFTGEGDR
jgi:peptidoglycan/xylan/chitin deacetylase (PgdA/CDA1 family)